MKKLKDLITEDDRPYPIYGLFLQLSSWMDITHSQLEQAKKSSITNKNNKIFAKISKDWLSGRYEDNPESIYDRAIKLLN